MTTFPPREHDVDESCGGEQCRMCKAPATHKIAEENAPAWFHPMTAYLCCWCFRKVLGLFHDSYPYAGVEIS